MNLPLEGHLQAYRRMVPVFFVTAGLFVATAVFMWMSSGNTQAFLDSRTVSYPVELEPFPQQLETWYSVKEQTVDSEVVDALGLDTWLSRHYAKQDVGLLHMYVGHIEKESFDYANRHHLPTVCYPNQGWQILVSETETIQVEGEERPINRLLVKKGPDEQLLLYWFLAGGQPTFVDRWGRLGIEMAWAASISSAVVTDQRTDKSFIRLSTSVRDGDQEQAWTRLVDFAQTAYPELEQLFN